MSSVQRIDSEILMYIQENFRNPFFDSLFETITYLGSGGLIWIILLMSFLFVKRFRITSFQMAGALIISSVSGILFLKNIIERPRPFYTVAGLKPLITPSGYSFPSGHTASSFAAAFIIFMNLPRKYGIAALILAVFISFSRIYLGVHYPTDVFAGFILGAVSAQISKVIWKKTVEGN